MRSLFKFRIADFIFSFARIRLRVKHDGISREYEKGKCTFLSRMIRAAIYATDNEVSFRSLSPAYIRLSTCEFRRKCLPISRGIK